MKAGSPLDRIRRTFERSDDVDRAEGAVSYARYQATLARIGARLGYGLPATAAAFCALSPNNDYMGNLRSMVTLMDGHRRGLPLSEITVSTYRSCAARAWRVLDGEDFLSFTKGPKTRNFYQNIVDPSDPYPITIDGHMMSIWVGERLTMKQAVMKRLKYPVLADDYRKVAEELGMVANQLQATLWFTWKRIHDVVYTPQMSLFQLVINGDLTFNWKTYGPMRPERILTLSQQQLDELPELKEGWDNFVSSNEPGTRFKARQTLARRKGDQGWIVGEVKKREVELLPAKDRFPALEIPNVSRKYIYWYWKVKVEK